METSRKFNIANYYINIFAVLMGPIPYNEQNFDLDKSRQTFHHRASQN